MIAFDPKRTFAQRSAIPKTLCRQLPSATLAQVRSRTCGHQRQRNSANLRRLVECAAMARILVVEDNAATMKLTTLVLQNAGHTVLCAVDAEIGLTPARPGPT